MAYRKRILDGVYLTQTAASPVWQTYFRAHGKTYIKTTRKRDFEQAKMAALSMYYDIQRGETGLDKPNVASFEKLAEVYKAHVRKRMMSNYHVDTLNRHFVPYFGEVTDVREINQPMVTRYIESRLAKSTKPPTPQTLNRENTVLQQIFRHAAIQGWFDETPEIPNYSEKNTRKRRRHFTSEEYRTLHRTARKRISRVGNAKLQMPTFWHRQLLYDVILLIANSGLRVNELLTLRWRNVDFSAGHVVLERAGKTKSSRRVIVRPSGMMAIKRIRDRRHDWLDSQGDDERVKATDAVLTLPDGTVVKSFKKGFNALLEKCGFI
tara:strand:- start:357 stop:1322 length:966 start_codon:yes stop_codon:yes gene_type:complete